jgi:hypothetical protein
MIMPGAGKPPIAASLLHQQPAPAGEVSGVERGRGCLAAGRVDQEICSAAYDSGRRGACGPSLSACVGCSYWARFS